MRWAKRLRALFGKDTLDAEINEELRFHLERAVEEKLGLGLPLEQARMAALQEVGVRMALGGAAAGLAEIAVSLC